MTHKRTRSRSRTPRAILALAGAAALMAGSPAAATWSIIIVDTRTGEVAIGSATCLNNFDLQAGTPVMIVGVGGATAQSSVDGSGQNRAYIRDQFLLGTSPQDMLPLLAAFDPSHQSRQYGMVDALGRAATFSGTGAGAWAGGVTGQVGDLVYAVQGNVLAGEPVVAAAVQAILDTPGDLAAKLMASMEAARSMGGDGRCSCANNDPDGCGAPPPDFEKSAEIAYMLIGRTGDLDGSTGIYRSGFSPTGLAVHDFSGDGLPDLLAAASASNDLYLLTNQTSPADPFAHFAQPQTIPLGSPARDVAVADLDNDGLVDLAVASAALNAVSVLRGQPGGTFAAPVAFPVGADPRFLIVRDFDGDSHADIATGNVTGASVSVLFGDGQGGFAAAFTLAAGGGIAGIAAADLNLDGKPDLCYAGQSIGAVMPIFNQGDRTFKLGAPMMTNGSPRAVVAHDFDLDGDDDLAAPTHALGTVCLFWNTAGSFQREDLTPGGDPIALSVGDANGDGNDDLFVLRGSTSRDFLVYTGDNQGGFSPSAPFVTGPGNVLIAAADLNGDGLDDAAALTGGTRSVYTFDNQGLPLGPVTFPSGIGSATGDYFMEFNIAFQSDDDPDPVFGLQAMFDQWRTDLIGRPDAVQSIASLDPATLPPDGASQAMLLVSLRDWQGQPAPGASLSVVHAPGSDGLSGIGPVVDLGQGQFSIAITAGEAPGHDAFRVVADDGVRPVTLMPDIGLSIACGPDCDASGGLDLFDFLCFVNQFNANDPAADCDASGGLDLFDFLCFVNAFNAGC